MTSYLNDHKTLPVVTYKTQANSQDQLNHTLVNLMEKNYNPFLKLEPMSNENNFFSIPSNN